MPEYGYAYRYDDGGTDEELRQALGVERFRMVCEYPAIWEFPKMRGTLFWGPYNQDPTI